MKSRFEATIGGSSEVGFQQPPLVGAERPGPSRFPATRVVGFGQPTQKGLAISLTASESDPQHISDVCSEAYNDYVRLHESSDSPESAAPRTGFANLDSLVDGLEPGSGEF
jgi:hypothetical protein